MSTENSIHGHELLYLVRDLEPAPTRAGLAAEVSRRFGEGVRFHTCSMGGVGLDELVAFLLARGKLVEKGGRLYTDVSMMCADGQHQH